MEEAVLHELKGDVRKYFARVYSALKARELQTLRQVEALGRHRTFTTLPKIDISFDNEDKLFDEIHKFGVIDFKKLNLDSDLFIMEDYISPNDDHIYSYKCLDDICDKNSETSLKAIIEENAFKEITSVNNCVCSVNVSPDEVTKKFQEYNTNDSKKNDVSDSLSESFPELIKVKSDDSSLLHINNLNEESLTSPDDNMEDKISNNIIQKLNPIQDWLNQIINETETEPSQIVDLMEHSAIECS